MRFLTIKNFANRQLKRVNECKLTKKILHRRMQVQKSSMKFKTKHFKKPLKVVEFLEKILIGTFLIKTTQFEKKTVQSVKKRFPVGNSKNKNHTVVMRRPSVPHYILFTYVLSYLTIS